ncbi:hypothetical protein [Actinoallomurus iriomotensis]|uniref:Uncharacterized protein n=1 Tax=Actinoallomurus iriomotensis TaxID=478107 RepID=A0A9W6VHN8_9ACTN|nr:hypothetical protein [Actinoallomurus iriomotensis]GLY72083.1 hypothetical protein Airi01_003500 [Actinoallomurus iriomotensis]
MPGHLAGDVRARLTATIGGFTGLYGSGRPYLGRAALLAVVAAAATGWAAVLVVAVIAVAATCCATRSRSGRRGRTCSHWRARPYDASTGPSAAVRRAAERLRPAVVATERSAYRLPAACWAAERDGEPAVPGAAGLPATLADLAAAAREGTGPPEEGEPPEFLAEEVAAVRESLFRAETEPAP